MNTFQRLSFFAFLVLLNIQCSKKIHPIDTTENMISAPPLPASNLNLTIHVSRTELNATLNYLVNNLFNEGFSIEDGVSIHTSISGYIDMQAVNNQINTTIPLLVDIIPGGIFKRAKVKGIISVQFATNIEIFQDQLLNKTELVDYNWVSKPVINILGLNLPIEPIANFIVKKYKTDICQSIDESIKQNFNLNTVKVAAQKFFTKPLYSTEDSIIHVFASPLELAIGPMSMTLQELQIPVIFYFESVIAESKPQDLFNDPTFSIRPYFDNMSSFYIQSRLPLPYIEQILREQIENQKFGSGMSSITVHRINMSGNDKKLSIMMDVSGGYNGKMELSFDPIYEKEDQKIKLENFKLKTFGGIKLKKILFSIIKGFAENKLRNTVEEQINLNLENYLLNINKMLAGTEIIPGVFMSGKLLDYEIKDIRFYNYRMYFNISSKLIMNAEVRHIDTSRIILKKS